MKNLAVALIAAVALTFGVSLASAAEAPPERGQQQSHHRHHVGKHHHGKKAHGKKAHGKKHHGKGGAAKGHGKGRAE